MPDKTSAPNGQLAPPISPHVLYSPLDHFLGEDTVFDEDEHGFLISPGADALVIPHTPTEQYPATSATPTSVPVTKGTPPPGIPIAANAPVASSMPAPHA
eukprot:m.80253 g.80253  ORF g.80253 m.80253 type:complete len:100 (+) comp8202_c0_seq2:1783-2082(+)